MNSTKGSTYVSAGQRESRKTALALTTLDGQVEVTLSKAKIIFKGFQKSAGKSTKAKDKFIFRNFQKSKTRSRHRSKFS